jgi:SHS2 domain-containing protein
MRYKYLEHTADIKFQAFGKSIEEAFENSALAMFHAMHDGKIKNKKIFEVKAEGKDYESLLYNFLEELLILFDSKGFFLSEIKKLEIKNKKLKALVAGDEAKNYGISIDIKAVTYNEMFVREEKKGKWIAQVVVDV